MKKDLLAAAVISAYNMTHDVGRNVGINRKPDLSAPKGNPQRRKDRKRSKQARRRQRRK